MHVRINQEINKINFSNEIAISIFTLFKERQLSDKSNTQPFIHFSNSFKMQQFLIIDC